MTERFPQLDLKVAGCAKKCKLCREKPFAVVDGVPLGADSWEELKLKLEEML